MKPSFTREINLGHVLVAVSMITSLLGFAFIAGGDVKVIKSDVARHERQLERMETAIVSLTATEASVAQNLSILTALFNEHCKHTLKTP